MISIIIPVLNERQTLGQLLEHLDRAGKPSNISEIIVVDGGSDDGTPALVTSYTQKLKLKLALVHSEKGRAVQMNAGAKESDSDILYFLHADSYPPTGFDELIRSEVGKGYDSGCFRMKFDSEHPILKLSQWFTRFNWKMCRGGDQSLFITHDAFDKLGGFNTMYTIYEDCELIGRIYDRFKFTIIKKPLTTSARKYKQIGTVKLQYFFMVIHLKKMMGAGPEELQQYYKRKIVATTVSKKEAKYLISGAQNSSK